MSQRSGRPVTASTAAATTASTAGVPVANTTASSQPNLATQQNNNKQQQYDRIRVLGKGSFGTAIVHRRRADCSLVVLKEIDLQRFKGEREKLSAINEARIMSTLSHVNIIKYHSAYTTETKLVIEMEYASIGTLAAYLSFQVQPLEEQEILVIFRQITSGLSYLHSKNVVHLDLKMANIFVTIEGLVKIGDFSISQYMNSVLTVPASKQQQLTAEEAATGTLSTTNRKQQHSPAMAIGQPTSSHLGTIAYSSPERCLGEQTDFKSDIWSLGCILYELMSSRPLFAADSLPELVLCITRIQYQPITRQDLSAGLREIFEQTIAREPAQRPTAKELHSITGQLLSRVQLHRGINLNNNNNFNQPSYKVNGGKRATNQHHQNHRFDLSTELALLAAHQNNQDDVGGHSTAVNQINYPHSLVYQVRLDSQHIELGRVNLPQTKRIKLMAKGESHYLVLTYDNIVYGWGSRSRGQLGACGLTSSSMMTSKHRGAGKSDATAGHSAASSAASSTQTIVMSGCSTKGISSTGVAVHQPMHNSRQLLMNLLEELAPTGRPFVINELNHRKIVQVAAGIDFSVFLSKTGIVMTCGDGSRGCLGRGDLKSCCSPCMVESLLNNDVVCIGAGPEHVVAVCGNGRVFAWGKNKHGRLGIARDSPKLGSISDATGRFVLTPQPVNFPGGEQVFVKSVFCGDRCTVFIDAQDRCWASGENRHNKLGLDVKRRFKRTLIVEHCWTPCEIQPLAKHKIISCSIGRNHSSFVTSEGKLIVFGQDIDYTYRLRSSIMSARDSHRRISFELQTTRRRSLSQKQVVASTSGGGCAASYRRLAHWSLIANQLAGFKKSGDSSTVQVQVRKLALSRFQLKQISSYLRKSRAIKKMPFEGAISVSCTDKFTLALTSDNHVYFWGVRSHKQQDVVAYCPTSAEAQCKSCARQHKRPVEPHLVPCCSDECFIKIGATNSSLMSSIQILGSDQPIIHAQDPRLRAKSLADLWILDYQPSGCSSCSSSSASSTCPSSASSTSTSTSTCCSTCSSSWSLCSAQSHCSASQPTGGGRNEGPADCMKYAAILEPQPLVSLYVPSMFNHSGCSMHLVDLFCFDDDRFYLILDTTVMLQVSSNGRYSSTPSSSQQQQAATSRSTAQTPTARTMRLSSLGAEPRSAQVRRHLPATGAGPEEAGVANCVKSTPTINQDSNQQMRGAQQVTQQPLATLESQGAQETKQLVSLRGCVDVNAESRRKLAKEELTCDNNNNNNSNHDHNSSDSNNNNIDGCNNNDIIDGGDQNNLNNHNNNSDATAVSSSHGTVSLEEPRSLSTFATVLGNHIIVSPNLRIRHQQDQAQMQPLTFANQQSQQETTTDSQVGSGHQIINHHMNRDSSHLLNQNNLHHHHQQNHLLMDRRRSTPARCQGRQTNKSEMTGLTGGTTDNMDETSSMPSWVRNEYIDQQQHQIVDISTTQTTDDDQNHLFHRDSFSSDDGDNEHTCTSGSIFASNNETAAGAYNSENSSNLGTTDSSAESTAGGSEIHFNAADSREQELLTSCESLPHVAVESEYEPADKTHQQQVLRGSLYRQGKPLLMLSMSQPDISETLAEAESPVTRRASVLVEQEKQVKQKTTDLGAKHKLGSGKATKIINNNHSSNLLDCSIYQGASRHQYQSSTFDVGLSTRSNSNNPLIRNSEQIGTTTCAANYSVSQAQLPVTGGTVEAVATHSWSKLDSYAASYKRGSVASAHLIGNSQQVRARSNQQQHHLSCQSIRLPSARNKPKTASNLSLGSLRKSFVKLFC